MHELKTGINTDKFAIFGFFQKVFITHSFYKWALYPLQPAERSFEKSMKTCESVKRNAELFL